MDTNIFKSLKTNEERELYVLKISEHFTSTLDLLKLGNLLTTLQTHWEGLSIARLSKIIKKVFETIPVHEKDFEILNIFLTGLIEWADDKKMLKLDLECKLINVYLNVGRFAECLKKIVEVTKELKKYDDKNNLIALYVCESKAYYELSDFNRAKSSLTAARALAVSSACSAKLQAEIDLINGMYLSDEKSFDTAISYFIESMEGFLQDKDMIDARVALRYIVLNKILLSSFDDIPVALSSKAVKSIKDDKFITIMCSISEACKNRDLHEYNNVLFDNSSILDLDTYVKRHLFNMYESLLENNILKIIEPYSHVKINFISSKLKLSEDSIEEKLRKMILDKKINGILDHDTQCLILYDLDVAEFDSGLKNIQLLKEFFSLIE